LEHQEIFTTAGGLGTQLTLLAGDDYKVDHHLFRKNTCLVGNKLSIQIWTRITKKTSACRHCHQRLKVAQAF